MPLRPTAKTRASFLRLSSALLSPHWPFFLQADAYYVATRPFGVGFEPNKHNASEHQPNFTLFVESQGAMEVHPGSQKGCQTDCMTVEMVFREKGIPHQVSQTTSTYLDEPRGRTHSFTAAPHCTF